MTPTVLSCNLRSWALTCRSSCHSSSNERQGYTCQDPRSVNASTAGDQEYYRRRQGELMPGGGIFTGSGKGGRQGTS
jgi:hypothetical protein